MEDHRLGDLLRELPREQARPGFTARVLHRLDAPRRRRLSLIPRLALATALTFVLIVTAGLLVDARRDALANARAERALAEIRAEHARLEREVQDLSQPPVVYLGGNEDVDLVLDLGKVRGSEGATPAAYHGETF
jgi:cell division protein FtsB